MGKIAKLRPFAENETSAKLRQLRTSPRKLNLIAQLIRGMPANKALVQLQFCKRRVSDSVYKLPQSAIANAENNQNLDVDYLVVSEVRVGKSLTMKRFKARARGRGARIIKPFSTIEIVLREELEGV